MKKTLDVPFRKKVSALIKERNNFVDTYVQELIQPDENAHIEVDLRHGNPVFETYSSGHDLANSIFDYINNVAKYLPVTVPVVVDFKINPAQEPLEAAIKREFLTNYRFEFDEKRAQAKLTKYKGYAMMGIGVLFLLGYILLVYFLNQDPNNLFLSVASNVISIVSWVFIWDAVDKWSFEEKDYQKQSLRKAQLATASVNFIVEKDIIIKGNKK